MSDPRIIKELYKVTKNKVFTVEDLRDYGLHNKFRHKNQIGSFFRWRNSVGYTEAMGVGRATHQAANKRWIWRWRWTPKAHQEFGNLESAQSLLETYIVEN